MTTATAEASSITLPTLAQGEAYAGLILNDDGHPAHHLILLPGEAEEAAWDDAVAWAKNAGGDLPTRREQSLLFANCKQHFQRDWYWSGEQHASDSDYAWRQHFYGGDQDGYRKSYEGRARAVRRSVI